MNLLRSLLNKKFPGHETCTLLRQAIVSLNFPFVCMQHGDVLELSMMDLIKAGVTTTMAFDEDPNPEICFGELDV